LDSATVIAVIKKRSAIERFFLKPLTPAFRLSKLFLEKRHIGNYAPRSKYEHYEFIEDCKSLNLKGGDIAAPVREISIYD
jgi:hypothetical protein